MSEEIKQQSWYSESWDLDPAVNAMMDMLDAIGNKYNGLKMHVAAQMLERCSLPRLSILTSWIWVNSN